MGSNGSGGGGGVALKRFWAVGSDEDHGNNSNGRGHMKQPIKMGSRRNGSRGNDDWQLRQPRQWGQWQR